MGPLDSHILAGIPEIFACDRALCAPYLGKYLLHIRGHRPLYRALSAHKPAKIWKELHIIWGLRAPIAYDLLRKSFSFWQDLFLILGAAPPNPQIYFNLLGAAPPK